MNSLQLLVVLLSLSNTEANYCNIFNEEFQQKDVAHRCNRIRKAVEKALHENDVYHYIHHEIFDINSFHRPPTTIIFHYVVKINESNTSGDIHTESIISGPYEGSKPDKTDSVAAEGNYNFSIGWSSANIYTFVRPEFILSLQPAWFLNSLKFSIHEHVGFSREVTLHVTLQGKSLPPNTTVHEIWHSLEHATAKIKANDASRTYIWKPISKTNPTIFIDIIYTMVVLTVSLVSIIFLFYFIPYTKLDDFCGRYPLVWIGFAVQWLGNIALEIYHTKETYGPGIYGYMRISIMVIGQPIIDIIIFCTILVFLCVHKCGKSPEILKMAYYALVITFGWSLLRQLIMLLFYAFVYAAEPISVVGIVAFGVIFTVMWSYVSNGVYKRVNTKCVKWLLLIICVIIDIFVYFSIVATTYFAIMVYITFLNSLPKSPGDDGLVLKLICAFLPSLLTAGFTFCLNRWGPKNETQTAPAPETKRQRSNYGSLSNTI